MNHSPSTSAVVLESSLPMLYKRVYFPEIFVFLWLRICFIARVEFFWVWILINLKRIRIKEGISKIILNSFERMPFDNQRSHFSISTNIFHYLMKSGWTMALR